MGGRGSSNPRSGGGSGNNAQMLRRVNAQVVIDWADSHGDSAMTYALNPPDSITVGGVKFNNITGDAMRSVASARANEYTVNYQSDIQASNGEFPVIQVTVTEKLRSTESGTVRQYSINKQKTKLW